MTKEEVIEAVKSVDWYHHIDLGHGIVTKGIDVPFFDEMELPLDLHGKRVLDIGALNGYHSFKCEERGAQVLATDGWAWGEARTEGENRTFATKIGFDVAKKILNSQVEEMKLWVHEITPERVGMFDFVLILGVIYHLKNPMEGLQCAWNVTKDTLVLETFIDQRCGEDLPCAVFYPGTVLNNDPTNWWGPNLCCAKAMLESLDPTPSKVELVSIRHKKPMRAIYKAYR